jgi:hypothetical protein
VTTTDKEIEDAITRYLTERKIKVSGLLEKHRARYEHYRDWEPSHLWRVPLGYVRKYEHELQVLCALINGQWKAGCSACRASGSPTPEKEKE